LKYSFSVFGFQLKDKGWEGMGGEGQKELAASCEKNGPEILCFFTAHCLQLTAHCSLAPPPPTSLNPFL
jgi:hypothetical protein